MQRRKFVSPLAGISAGAWQGRAAPQIRGCSGAESTLVYGKGYSPPQVRAMPDGNLRRCMAGARTVANPGIQGRRKYAAARTMACSSAESTPVHVS